jgi:hypothetical protein
MLNNKTEITKMENNRTQFENDIKGREIAIDDVNRSYATEANLNRAMQKDARVQSILEAGACYIRCRTMTGRWTIIFTGNTAAVEGAHFTGFNCIY